MPCELESFLQRIGIDPVSTKAEPMSIDIEQSQAGVRPRIPWINLDCSFQAVTHVIIVALIVIPPALPALHNAFI